MTNLIGPDVSFYQDDPETPQGIDFRKMRASAGYVIIRAGQNAWVDSDFKINWREAKLAGLRFEIPVEMRRMNVAIRRPFLHGLGILRDGKFE